MIRLAEVCEADTVYRIRDEAIRAVYPRYHPRGAVDWFLSPDNRRYIAADVARGAVYVLENNGLIAGTVTVADGELQRLFVLPDEQGKGCGRALAEFAVRKIFEDSELVRVHAALSATKFYEKLGFRLVSAESMITASGDYLCWNILEKKK